MKKKILLAVSSIVIASSLVGCSMPFVNNQEPVANTANFFEDNKITEDEEINTGRSEDAFTEALTAAIKNENITIGMNFSSSYGDKENLINNIKLKFDYAKEKLASVNIVSNYNGQETKENGYYKDGYYYSDSANGKTKTAEDFSNFLIENDGYSMEIYSGIVSKLACVENGKSKTYYLQYDPVGYEEQLVTNMEAQGEQLEQDESMVVNYANLVFTVDENGMMSSYKFSTNTTHKSKEGENQYNYDISVDFSDIGSTKVDALGNLDEYVDSSTIDSTSQNNEVATENVTNK